MLTMKKNILFVLLACILYQAQATVYPGFTRFPDRRTAFQGSFEEECKKYLEYTGSFYDQLRRITGEDMKKAQALVEKMNGSGIEAAAHAFELPYATVAALYKTEFQLFEQLKTLAQIDFPNQDRITADEFKKLLNHINEVELRLNAHLAYMVPDCWKAYVECKRTAHLEYIESVAESSMGALGVSTVVPLLGLGLGIGAIIVHGIKYENSKKMCLAAYKSCMNN